MVPATFSPMPSGGFLANWAGKAVAKKSSSTGVRGVGITVKETEFVYFTNHRQRGLRQRPVVTGRITVVASLVVVHALLNACGTTARSAGDAGSATGNAVAEETSEQNNAATSGTQNLTDSLGTSSQLIGEPAPSGSEPRIAKPRTTTEIIPGTGNFINRRAAARKSGQPGTAEGDIILNFEQSDIRDVIQTILGDVLGVNYAIDPGVTGKVSLATSRPVDVDSVLPILESLLKMHRAVLTIRDDIYLVTPETMARLSALKPSLQPDADRGYQIVVVPLQFIATSEMEAVLKPLIADGSILAANSQRHYLIVAGTVAEIENMLDTIDIFDVDFMQGMSVGFFTLEMADASTVRDELANILGADSDGPIGDMLRFMTVDRLNALVVITPQKRYLETAETWIRRLDHADDEAGSNMFVYPVQNARAVHLAQLLNELFAEGSATLSRTGGSGSRSPSPFRAAEPEGQGMGTNSRTATLSVRGLRDTESIDSKTRIIADDENNSLLIMANRTEYARIMSAIRKLDVIPLQVLVEVSIIEVQLTGELSYGLQWFFKNSVGDSKTGLGALFPLSVDPSFSYTILNNNGEVRAILNLLAAESKLDVLSSPSLLVQDNHTAIIKIGDQVPIRTSETTSLSTSGIDPLITSQIQYLDTGVSLEVTPRVNQGGLVSLEISQDVSDVDETTTSDIDSPTIFQRLITTTVAVQSGETIILGGLIRENKSESETGIPGLRSIPGIGRLFGSKTTSSRRTELIILITPTAIMNMSQARAATLEMQQKMPSIRLQN